MVAALAGCVKPSLVDCPSGNQCADGQACDTVHGGCVDPEQDTACDGKTEGDTCSWSTQTGRCFDGVCIVPGCGNLVVEDGEQCDDGNRVSNDGCSADCTSTEICGNGFVDVAEGEECDDGNLRSHDGCDSTCHSETIAWQAIGIGPEAGVTGHGAFDVQRGVLVHVADGITWEWDGTAWKIAATTGLPQLELWFTLAYDPTKGTTLYLGGTFGHADTFAAWDGTAWTQLPLPSFDVVSAVSAYDANKQQLVVFGADAGSNVLSLVWDDPTQAWSTLFPPDSVPVTQGGMAMAFDKLHATVVLYAGGTAGPPEVSPAMFQLVDDAWSPGPAVIPDFPGAPAIVFDETRNTLVAVGGNSFGVSGTAKSANLYALTGVGTPTWKVLPAPLPTKRDQVELVYDPKGAQLIAFGGRGSISDVNAPLDDLVVNTALDVNQWVPLDPHAPRAAADEVAAIDGRRGTLVLVQRNRDDGQTETWTFAAGAWTRLPIAGAPALSGTAVMTYDPLRDRMILVDSNGKTFAFDPTAQVWSDLAASGPDTPFGVIFDPERAQLVAVGEGGTMTLGPTDDVWTGLTAAPPFKGVSSATVGYDAREHAIQAISSEAVAVELAGASVDWDQTLSPGDHYRLVGDPRLGGVDYVSPRGVAWQRVGTSFTQSEGQPLPVDGTVLSNPITGDLVVLGEMVLGDGLDIPGSSRIVLVRSATSSSREEDCSGGSDVDGDGLVGCDDPDCFWTCTPACPPFATCP